MRAKYLFLDLRAIGKIVDNAGVKIRNMSKVRPRAARPLRPGNTMQQAGLSAVGVVVEERDSTMKEDVMRLVEAQIAGGVDLSPEEMVEAAFIMVGKINDRL